MTLPRRNIDWQPLREAYVQRPSRPSYDDLSTEFAVDVQAIYRASADEGWPALRNAWLESQAKAADATEIILAAVKGDRAVSQAYLSLALVTLSRLQRVIESIPDDRAASTQTDIMSNAMFAARNLADALKSVGIIGIARAMNGAGKEDNGRWNPEMLQQINVTVQQLTAKQAELGGGKAGVTVETKTVRDANPSKE